MMREISSKTRTEGKSSELTLDALRKARAALDAIGEPPVIFHHPSMNGLSMIRFDNGDMFCGDEMITRIRAAALDMGAKPDLKASVNTWAGIEFVPLSVALTDSQHRYHKRAHKALCAAANTEAGNE